jgi:hypothetical protein
MFEMPPPRGRKKKVDYEALHSPLKRIPGLTVAEVRDLLDLGIRQIDELSGRSPQVLFDEVREMRKETPDDRLWAFRLAVYYAETPEPDPKLLSSWQWKDRSL